jgi:hypothetical protein
MTIWFAVQWRCGNHWVLDQGLSRLQADHGWSQHMGRLSNACVSIWHCTRTVVPTTFCSIIKSWGEIRDSKNSGHSTSLRRICRSAWGRLSLNGLTNQNKTSWLNEIVILLYCHIAILTIGNQDIATCQKCKGWISGGIHRISGQIILIFIISILNNLMLLLETFLFMMQYKNNPATCEMSSDFGLSFEDAIFHTKAAFYTRL